MAYRDFHEANRKSWNEATIVHNKHKGDQVAFFNNGGTMLFPEETELLGDVRGKSLVHLQCNGGQDTLSIAKYLGANVTGVDISDTAVEFARWLSTETGIPATFQRADIFDWFDQNTDEFDVVFVSYGALTWLADLNTWGKGIARTLKPGGKFVLVEFHPLILIFDFNGNWKPEYDYFGGKMVTNDDGVGDYVGAEGGELTQTGLKLENVETFHNPNPTFEFTWGLSDVITALLDAGMQLTTLREYPFINGWKPFPDLRELPGRRMALPEGMPNLPMMYGIVAEKTP